MSAIQESLKFSPTVFVLQIILFLLLLQVMTQVFWKPMLGHLYQRKNDTEAQYAARDGLQVRMERLRAEYQESIARMETEARASIAKAVHETQLERDRILMEARQAADKAIKEGLVAAEVERIAALELLRPKVTNAALSVAGETLGTAVSVDRLRSHIEARVSTSSSN